MEEKSFAALRKALSRQKPQPALEHFYAWYYWMKLRARSDLLPERLASIRGTPPKRGALSDKLSQLELQAALKQGALKEARKLVSELSFLKNGIYWSSFSPLAPPQPGQLKYAQAQSLAPFAPWGKIPSGALTEPDTLFYLGATIKLKRRGHLSLALSGGGELAVLLNGSLLTKEKAKDAALIDQYRYQLTLPPGEHFLLLQQKVRSSEDSLQLRLTAPQGGPSKVARFIEVQPKHIVPQDLRPIRFKPLQRKLSLRAGLYHKMVSLQDISVGQTAFPVGTGKLEQALLNYLRYSPSGPLANDMGPFHDLALLKKAKYLASHDQAIAALQVLNQLDYPQEPLALLQKLTIENNYLELTEQQIRSYLKRQSIVHSGPLAEQLSYALVSREAHSQNRQLLTRILQADRRQSWARRQLIEAYLEEADYQAAERLVQEQINYTPHSPRPYLQQVYLDQSSAPKRAQQLSQLFPNNPSLQKRLQEHLALRGLGVQQLSGPKEELKWSSEKQITSWRQQAESFAAAYPVIILSQSTQVAVDQRGRSAKQVEIIYQLRKDNGHPSLEELRFYYHPGIHQLAQVKAELWPQAGAKRTIEQIADHFPQSQQGNMFVDLAYFSVRPGKLNKGALVVVRYLLKPTPQNPFGDYFGDLVHPDGWRPTWRYDYQINYPGSYQLSFGSNSPRHLDKSDQSDGRRLRFTLLKYQPLPFEALQKPPQDLPTLSISHHQSPEELSRWYQALWRPQLDFKADPGFFTKIGIRSAMSEIEKVEQLYFWLAENNRYLGIELGIQGFRPHASSETLRTGYGDCKDKASLLVDLLAKLDIAAQIVLVRTAERSPTPQKHANLWAYNHAFIYLPQHELYLDPTAVWTHPGELPAIDQGAQAIRFGPQGPSQLTELPVSQASQNRNWSHYTLKLSKDAPVGFEGIENYLSTAGASIRKLLSRQQQRQKLMQERLQKGLPGLQLTQLQPLAAGIRSATVSYQLKGELRNYQRQHADGRSIVPASLFKHHLAATYAFLEQRQTDLLLAYPFTVTNRVHYDFGEAALLHRPQDSSVKGKYLEFTRSFTERQGGLIVEETLRLRKRQIPARGYSRFRQNCLEIDRIQQSHLEVRW